MSSLSNSATIKDLLHEVTDGVEPGDRLDAIRAATASERRTSRGWWAAGGVGLVAASAVAALALTTGAGPRGSEPGPAEQSTAASTTTEPNPVETRVVPVYFVGDTPSGPRLYREFQRRPASVPEEIFALDAALSGDALDPDYRSLWPVGTRVGGYVASEDITVDLVGDVHDRPTGMTEAEAGLAVEQLVRTAQALFQQGRVPVRLTIDSELTDQVLGVPTSEPLSAAPDPDVLAPVSLSNPSEGLLVDNDEPLTVKGVGASADDRASLRIQRWEGTAVLRLLEVDLEPSDAHLAPFSVRWSLESLPPGDYDLVATVTDTDGTLDTDTRRITVVD